MKNIVVCAMTAILCVIVNIPLSAQESDDLDKFTISPYAGPMAERRWYWREKLPAEFPRDYGEFSVGYMAGVTMWGRKSYALSLGYFRLKSLAGPYIFSDSALLYQGVHLSMRFPVFDRVKALRVGFMYNGGKYGRASPGQVYRPGDLLCHEIGPVFSYQFEKSCTIRRFKYLLETEFITMPGYVAPTSFVLNSSVVVWFKW